MISWHRFYDPETGRYISADPIGLDGGINLYSYVQNDPINLVDFEGLSGSKPGGPYHPPEGVHFSCKGTDSCPVIYGKIWILERMLYSHIGWDVVMPAPRGGNRHAKEIKDLIMALAKCERFKIEKCSDCFTPPNPKPLKTGPGMLPITPVPAVP